MIAALAFAYKLFGFLEEAEQLYALHKSLKKKQDVADIPTTKQERTDAANKGDL